MRGQEIFVVGSFVAGITIRVARQPAPGETLMGNGFHLGPGGKGFNQAVAASRAGASVNLILCTGNDAFGDMAAASLASEQLPAEFLFRLDDIHTGCGVVTLLPSGENSIVVDAGANGWLSAEMIRLASKKIAASNIVMSQLEVPDDATAEAFALAKQRGCTTILNPAPARPLPPHIIRNTDILTPNETEARILLGLEPDIPAPSAQIVEGLRFIGFNTIILTRGSKGALIITDDLILEMPAPKIRAVDPTGAGDCFNGNLAAALTAGISLVDAVQRAVYAGAFCAGHLGVMDGIPTAQHLDEYINAHNS